MVRLSFGIFIALPIVSTLAFCHPAFITTSVCPACRFVTSHAVSSSPSEAELKLDKMADTWDALQRREQRVKQTRDETQAMKLAKDMLETAIEFTRAKEEVEKDHASSAHEALEKALHQEDALEAALQEAHHDVEADTILDNLVKHRELTFADVSHSVEDYAKSRLVEVKEAEFIAKMEETDALDHLQQLEQREQSLQAILKTLKVLEQKQQKL